MKAWYKMIMVRQHYRKLLSSVITVQRLCRGRIVSEAMCVYNILLTSSVCMCNCLSLMCRVVGFAVDTCVERFYTSQILITFVCKLVKSCEDKILCSLGSGISIVQFISVKIHTN